MTRIEFAFPQSQMHWWVIVSLLVLAGIVFALRWLEQRRRGRLYRFVESSLAPRLLMGYEDRTRRPLFWLTLLGFVFLALAFAQPRWGQAWQDTRKHSRDILVCLDTSESMMATAPLPTRLERAKQKINALLERAPGDRFGLIAFSGAADLQCPLTLDRGYFRAVLNAVDTATIGLEGTDIAAALREAVRVFEQEQALVDSYSRDNRAILLISDGEQVSGDALEAAEEAAKYARIYVIGVGDPKGTEITLPDWMRKYLGAGQGSMKHISKLDEDMLIRIAKTGSGPYVRSSADHWDIDQIYQWMGQLEARVVESDIRQHMVNRYQWPLAAAILCFIAEGVWLAALPWFRVWRSRRVRGNSEGISHA